jgi:hypothetical protein
MGSETVWALGSVQSALIALLSGLALLGSTQVWAD